jgi:NADPH:quinone reductase-like Zn-dependent oxidoreductase
VTASTGRPATHEYLAKLGATSFIERSALSEKGGTLLKERWVAAVDSVGSTTLTNVLSQTIYGGAVAACGLAGGADLPATVLRHMLRSVSLLGIDSVMAPLTRVEPMSALLQVELGADGSPRPKRQRGRLAAAPPLHR